MIRANCAGCGLSDLPVVLDLGSSPLADRFPPGDVTEASYPLQLCVCEHCDLAQLRCLIPDEELFGEDYGFLTGSSPASRRYFREWAGWALGRHYSESKLIIEIACNDGTLLKNFKGTGNRLLGVEPAMPAWEHAYTAGLDVEKHLFTEDYAEELAEKHGKAGLIIGCNVAAHVQDPLAFLRGVRLLLAKDGIAVFEFQSFEDLIADCQFDLVYHEHRFFYSLQTFTRLAYQAGLRLQGWQRTPAQGGSLRVTLGRASEGVCAGGWRPETSTLQSRADRVRDRLLELLRAYKGEGRIVAGYGASAKSATLLNFCGIDTELVGWVTDVTPSKIGRFTPGSHIPIVGDMRYADAYLLFVRNYLGPVLRRETRYLETGGQFIVPLPSPVII
jgi:methylation protein EvaC